MISLKQWYHHTRRVDKAFSKPMNVCAGITWWAKKTNLNLEYMSLPSFLQIEAVQCHKLDTRYLAGCTVCCMVLNWGFRDGGFYWKIGFLCVVQQGQHWLSGELWCWVDEYCLFINPLDKHQVDRMWLKDIRIPSTLMCLIKSLQQRGAFSKHSHRTNFSAL